MNQAYHKYTFCYTIKILAFMLVLAPISACNQTRSDTDEQRAFQIDQESIKLGKDGLKRFEKTIKYYPDTSLQQYVQQVGQRILQATPARHTPFTFRIIEAAYPQAYALPDGHIFITTGMLALFDNESQLAALFAHEIAHVVAGHTREKFRKRKQIATLTQKLNNVLDNSNTREMTRLFGKVSMQNYSRKNEYHADSLSVSYLQQSKYSRHAAIEVLELLQLSELQSLRKSSSKKRILSSHPAIGKRIEALKEFFQHKRTPSEKAYLMRINNLVLDRKKEKKLQLKLYTFTHMDALSQQLNQIEQQNHLLYQLILTINSARSANQLQLNQPLKWLIVADDKPDE